VVDYHNITPIEYWQPWEPSVTWGMIWGRRQLQELAGQSVAAIAHSAYSRREVEALDYRNPSVVPLLVDFSSFEHSVDDTLLQRLRTEKQEGGADLLFVGWVSPHKCQHDIIRAFSLYRSLYDPQARLHLVGRSGSETYAEACRKLIAELGLSDSVFMHGGVSDAELGAYFRIADALVSMSEHEGVGIPLLEAMYHRVPVVAFAAAAVPETVGDAGILLPRKLPALVAAAIHRVVSDVPLRNELVRRGLARLELFTLQKNRELLLEVLLPLTSNNRLAE
jgi:glycosyltransferase involved in cell wall biosynthesis